MAARDTLSQRVEALRGALVDVPREHLLWFIEAYGREPRFLPIVTPIENVLRECDGRT